LKPRLLYLTHRVPYPPDKGDRIRNFHVLRELANVARVTLVSLTDEPVTPGARAKLESLCETVAIVPSSGKRRWLRAGRSLLFGRSLSEGLFAEPALDEMLARLAETGRWDASLVSASSLTPYQHRHGLPAKPRFVDLVDVDSQKWFDYADAASGPKHALYSVEGHRVRKLEREIARWATATFIVSPSECEVFDGFTHAGAGTVATNGVDLDYFDPQPEVPTRPICAFVGALDYFPNIDAAIWFATDIWPGIRLRHPEAEFHIIGRKPTAAVLRLNEIAGVRVIADVPDVRPHLAEAALAVCPIRVARGLQNKVLEAMAMAKPTLAAPAAIRAIRAEVGKDLLSPTTESEWVSAVCDLLEDTGRRRELGSAGRRFVEEHHRWDRCLQPLAGAILAATAPKVPA
jgi:sugar transferase (PEP-CTERM/EpsH1 system associated)